MPAPDALAVFLRPKVLLEFDVGMNALAYMPLGAIACLILRGSNEPWLARMKAVAACAAFSLVMEALQLFVTHRVATIYDVLANTAGALAGTLVF
ncbi:MAG TPA: VanZ family protein, partial [Usitatibacteraceae bacterium]|nr:VanZ family protein [Usitatibacteraceae bacterium]